MINVCRMLEGIPYDSYSFRDEKIINGLLSLCDGETMCITLSSLENVDEKCQWFGHLIHLAQRFSIQILPPYICGILSNDAAFIVSPTFESYAAEKFMLPDAKNHPYDRHTISNIIALAQAMSYAIKHAITSCVFEIKEYF